MQLDEFITDFGSSGNRGTRNRVFLSNVDSTNALGKRIAASYRGNGNLLPPTLMVALRQTRGRGRLGNRWLSPTGGIYVSLLHSLPETRSALQLPMTLAVALCRTIDPWVSAPCRVKWPNDLMVRGRKLGGILIELVGNATHTTVVMGFGINYSAELPELTDTATCLSRESVDLPPLPQVAAKLIDAVESKVGFPQHESELVDEYSRWSLHRFGEAMICRTAGGVYQGEFQGFDSRGFLLLRTSAGEVSISSGDIIEGVNREHHES